MVNNAAQDKPIENRHSQKSQRRSLADLAAIPAPPVIETGPAPTPSPAPVARTAKYPSATVYLPPRAIRLLKEIGLEDNRRLTDILSEALDAWLVKNGHPSLEQLGQ